MASERRDEVMDERSRKAGSEDLQDCDQLEHPIIDGTGHGDDRLTVIAMHLQTAVDEYRIDDRIAVP